MGDLLSVIGDNVQISVKSDRGQMYVVQFTEWVDYRFGQEDEQEDHEFQGVGETLPSGRRVGPWTFNHSMGGYERGFTESGTYNRLGQRTGPWPSKSNDPNTTFKTTYLFQDGKYIDADVEDI